jgi:spoIIIJ-associated protein
MRIVEKSGKTVDEVKVSLQSELKLNDIYETCELDILQEPSPGFLGFGAKEAVVRAKINTDKNLKAGFIVSRMLELLGLETELKEHYDPQRRQIEFEFSGKNAERTISTIGESIEKLEYLAGLLLNRHEPEPYLKLRFRVRKITEARENYLKSTAKSMADKVISQKKPLPMAPMNSYERLIVHQELQGLKNIRTISEGQGTERHIVIEYTG